MPKALLWGYFLIVALLCVVAWPLLTDHLLTFGESAGRLLEAHDKGVTALFTIVLAIATAFLWHATYRLWIAGERQVKLSRDTAERQLRAYLTFRNLRIKPWKWEVDSVPFVTLELRNNGQTPAYNVKVEWYLDFAHTSSVKYLKPKIVDSPSYVLDPQTVSAFRGDLGKLSNEMIRRLKAGTHTIAVCAKVSYEDAFGRPRHTTLLASAPSAESTQTDSEAGFASEGVEAT